MKAPQAFKELTAETQRSQRNNQNLCGLCVSAVKESLMPAAQLERIFVFIRGFKFMEIQITEW